MKFLYYFITLLIFNNCQKRNNNYSDSNIYNHVITSEKNNVDTPSHVKSILKHYDNVIGYKDNKLIFSDSSFLIYDDGIKNKTINEIIKNPDVKAQFLFKYPLGQININNVVYDPGRIRNEDFFKKNYGASIEEVRKNLTQVIWCPKLVNQKILVTKINGVDKKIKLISNEIDEHPQFKKYVQNIGSFNWRKINGTDRLSMHSFGIAIDINTKFSNYWQWDCKCVDENKFLKYKNQIPPELVNIFEKHGFIWGGKWYHYDTMHFEYRPELFD